MLDSRCAGQELRGLASSSQLFGARFPIRHLTRRPPIKHASQSTIDDSRVASGQLACTSVSCCCANSRAVRLATCSPNTTTTQQNSSPERSVAGRPGPLTEEAGQQQQSLRQQGTRQQQNGQHRSLQAGEPVPWHPPPLESSHPPADVPNGAKGITTTSSNSSSSDGSSSGDSASSISPRGRIELLDAPLLTHRINCCSCRKGMAHLVKEFGEQMNPVHVTAVATRLTHLSRPEGTSAATLAGTGFRVRRVRTRQRKEVRQWRGLLMKVVELVERSAAGLDARGIANISWALVKVLQREQEAEGGPPGEPTGGQEAAVSSLQPEGCDRLGGGAAGGSSNLGVATLAAAVVRTVELLLSLPAADLDATSGGGGGSAEAAQSAPSGSGSAPGAAPPAGAAPPHPGRGGGYRGGGMTGMHVANVMWAVAVLSVHVPADADAAGRLALTGGALPGMAGGDPGGQRVLRGASGRWVAAALVASRRMLTAGAFTQEGLSQLIWAVEALGLVPGPDWMAAFYEATERRATELSARSTANVLMSLARMAESHPPAPAELRALCSGNSISGNGDPVGGTAETHVTTTGYFWPPDAAWLRNMVKVTTDCLSDADGIALANIAWGLLGLRAGSSGHSSDAPGAPPPLLLPIIPRRWLRYYYSALLRLLRQAGSQDWVQRHNAWQGREQQVGSQQQQQQLLQQQQQPPLSPDGGIGADQLAVALWALGSLAATSPGGRLQAPPSWHVIAAAEERLLPLLSSHPTADQTDSGTGQRRPGSLGGAKAGTDPAQLSDRSFAMASWGLQLLTSLHKADATQPAPQQSAQPPALLRETWMRAAMGRMAAGMRGRPLLLTLQTAAGWGTQVLVTDAWLHVALRAVLPPGVDPQDHHMLDRYHRHHRYQPQQHRNPGLHHRESGACDPRRSGSVAEVLDVSSHAAAAAAPAAATTGEATEHQWAAAGLGFSGATLPGLLCALLDVADVGRASALPPAWLLEAVAAAVLQYGTRTGGAQVNGDGAYYAAGAGAGDAATGPLSASGGGGDGGGQVVPWSLTELLHCGAALARRGYVPPPAWRQAFFGRVLLLAGVARQPSQAVQALGSQEAGGEGGAPHRLAGSHVVMLLTCSHRWAATATEATLVALLYGVPRELWSPREAAEVCRLLVLQSQAVAAGAATAAQQQQQQQQLGRQQQLQPGRQQLQPEQPQEAEGRRELAAPRGGGSAQSGSGRSDSPSGARPLSQAAGPGREGTGASGHATAPEVPAALRSGAGGEVGNSPRNAESWPGGGVESSPGPREHMLPAHRGSAGPSTGPSIPSAFGGVGDADHDDVLLPAEAGSCSAPAIPGAPGSDGTGQRTQVVLQRGPGRPATASSSSSSSSVLSSPASSTGSLPGASGLGRPGQPSGVAGMPFLAGSSVAAGATGAAPGVLPVGAGGPSSVTWPAGAGRRAGVFGDGGSATSTLASAPLRPPALSTWPGDSEGETESGAGEAVGSGSFDGGPGPAGAGSARALPPHSLHMRPLSRRGGLTSVQRFVLQMVRTACGALVRSAGRDEAAATPSPSHSDDEPGPSPRPAPAGGRNGIIVPSGAVNGAPVVDGSRPGSLTTATSLGEGRAVAAVGPPTTASPHGAAAAAGSGPTGGREGGGGGSGAAVTSQAHDPPLAALDEPWPLSSLGMLLWSASRLRIRLLRSQRSVLSGLLQSHLVAAAAAAHPPAASSNRRRRSAPSAAPSTSKPTASSRAAVPSSMPGELQSALPPPSPSVPSSLPSPPAAHDLVPYLWACSRLGVPLGRPEPLVAALASCGELQPPALTDWQLFMLLEALRSWRVVPPMRWSLQVPKRLISWLRATGAAPAWQPPPPATATTTTTSSAVDSTAHSRTAQPQQTQPQLAQPRWQQPGKLLSSADDAFEKTSQPEQPGLRSDTMRMMLVAVRALRHLRKAARFGRGRHLLRVKQPRSPSFVLPSAAAAGRRHKPGRKPQRWKQQRKAQRGPVAAGSKQTQRKTKGRTATTSTTPSSYAGGPPQQRPRGPLSRRVEPASSRPSVTASRRRRQLQQLEALIWPELWPLMRATVRHQLLLLLGVEAGRQRGKRAAASEATAAQVRPLAAPPQPSAGSPAQLPPSSGNPRDRLAALRCAQQLGVTVDVDWPAWGLAALSRLARELPPALYPSWLSAVVELRGLVSRALVEDLLLVWYNASAPALETMSPELLHATLQATGRAAAAHFLPLNPAWCSLALSLYSRRCARLPPAELSQVPRVLAGLRRVPPPQWQMAFARVVRGALPRMEPVRAAQMLIDAAALSPELGGMLQAAVREHVLAVRQGREQVMGAQQQLRQQQQQEQDPWGQERVVGMTGRQQAEGPPGSAELQRGSAGVGVPLVRQAVSTGVGR